ncbi:MAG TPA: hypothetical protein VK835_13655 [Bacteroidia bacterium]|nr:hypothetical protein [Bacteroidia bacterium]
MKKFVWAIFVMLFTCNAFAFTKADTLLHNKRFNVGLSGGLVVVKKSNYFYFSTKSWPNTNLHASAEHPFVGNITYQNGWSAAVNISIKIYKKLYAQTGLNFTVTYLQSSFGGDSMIMYGNTWCSSFQTKSAHVTGALPLGLEFRFCKWVFLGAGFLVGLYARDVGNTYYYNGTTLVGTARGGSNNGGVMPYTNINLRVLKRLYLNFGIVNTTWEKNGLNYNIGARFFIL